MRRWTARRADDESMLPPTLQSPPTQLPVEHPVAQPYPQVLQVPQAVGQHDGA